MSENGQGKLKCLWNWLSKPSAKYSILAIGGVAFVVGILFWGGFHTGLEMTNTTEFCIGCHDMRSTVYPEYKETIHYMNRSGVRAGCPDCHVPHEWGPKLWRKAQASLELYHKAMGTIDTPEKFEANRMPEYQKKSNYERHLKAKAAGKTCIDCHKGIAHHLPAEYEEPDD